MDFIALMLRTTGLCMVSAGVAFAQSSDGALSPGERKLADQWHASASAFETNYLHSAAKGQAGKTFQEQLDEDMSRARYALASHQTQPQISERSQSELDAQAFGRCLVEAESGLKDAQYRLGVIYATGHGVERNYKAAAKWYGKAADQGHADAQADLGFLLASGRGVTRDTEAAYLLWRLSSLGGSHKADTALWAVQNKKTFYNRRGEVVAEGAVIGGVPDRLMVVGDDGICCDSVQIKDLPDEIQKNLGFEGTGSGPQDRKQLKLLELRGQLGTWLRCVVRLPDGLEKEILLGGLPYEARAALDSSRSFLNLESALKKAESDEADAKGKLNDVLFSGSDEEKQQAVEQLRKAKNRRSVMRENYESSDTKAEFFPIRAAFTGTKFRGLEIWER